MFDQKLESRLSIFLLILGLILMYDAYKRRGKNTPFPFGAVTPW